MPQDRYENLRLLATLVNGYVQVMPRLFSNNQFTLIAEDEEEKVIVNLTIDSVERRPNP